MSIGKAGKNKRRIGVRRQLFENLLIVTDGDETETNFFNGLRSSFEPELQKKISIKVVGKINTQDLIETALRLLREDATIREPWIVFDCDNRPEDFDMIISKATAKGIHVAWSNPCIEIFFHAYYGKMPNNEEAIKCIEAFKRDFKRITGKEYKKNDSSIYTILLTTGDEDKALVLSLKTLISSIKKSDVKKPSNYCPASTLHELVGKVVKHRK